MKWLKRLFAALLVLVVVLVGVGFLLPPTVHVARSIAVDAPADEVFPLVNSFENFNKWSPWFGRDPDAEYRIHGPPSGVGAKMTWSSDQPDVGSGSQEIIESVPDERIRTALDFGEQGNATADITFAPAGSGTLV